MKTIIEYTERITIEEFADRHGLEMFVKQRDIPSSPSMGFFAHFRNAYIREGHCMVGATGNGATPEQAIEDYKARLNGDPSRIMVIDKSGESKREILLPKFE